MKRNLNRKTSLKSFVWKYFEKVNGPTSEGGICQLCNAFVAGKDGNTTNLKFHLSKKHENEYEVDVMSKRTAVDNNKARKKILNNEANSNISIIKKNILKHFFLTNDYTQCCYCYLKLYKSFSYEELFFHLKNKHFEKYDDEFVSFENGNVFSYFEEFSLENDVEFSCRGKFNENDKQFGENYTRLNLFKFKCKICALLVEAGKNKSDILKSHLKSHRNLFEFMTDEKEAENQNNEELRYEDVSIKQTENLPALFDLCEIWKSKLYSDVLLHCSDGTLNLHKIILASISPFLRSILTPFESYEAEGLEILLPDYKLYEVNDMFSNIYCGFTEEYKINQDLAETLKIFISQKMCNLNAQSGNDNLFGDSDKYSKNNSPTTNIICNDDAFAEDDSSDIDIKTDSSIMNDERSIEFNDESELETDQTQIWQFFEKSKSGGRCLSCGFVIFCRGGNISNMVSHLCNNHQDKYSQFLNSDIGNELKSENNENCVSQRNVLWNFFHKIDISSAKCIKCEMMFKLAECKLSVLLSHLSDEHVTDYSIYKKWQRAIASFSEVSTNVFQCLDCQEIIKTIDFDCLYEHMILLHEKKVKGSKGKGKNAKSKSNSSEVCDRDRTCLTCKKIFTNSRVMKDHVRFVHSGIKPYRCGSCGKSFARPDSFRSHTCGTEPKERPHVCSFCGKAFTRKSACQFHERIHRDDRRYDCSYCNKKFMSRQMVVAHERTHTGETPFVCATCGRQFKTTSQLLTHNFIHTGEKPYQCSTCGNSFRHISSRKNHKCVANKHFSI